MDSLVIGTSGAPGKSGTTDDRGFGTPGVDGAPGTGANAVSNAPGDGTNSAEATGGAGGDGGNGGNTTAPNIGGGRAGSGNAGGDALATAATVLASSSVTRATATATGGNGGTGGQGGALGPGAAGISLSGTGGPGGGASARASDTNTTGGAFASASATGGSGGLSTPDTQVGGGTYAGNIYQGGAGGSVAGTTASAVGTTSASASVTQTGGAGGSGLAGGAGGRSLLTNAVSGSTANGTLNLSQVATGGQGGSGTIYGAGGAGGAAESDLTLADASSAALGVTVTATGGAGGVQPVSGLGYVSGGLGGDAGATVGVTAKPTSRLSVYANAFGAAGGHAGSGTATGSGSGSVVAVTVNASGGYGLGSGGNAVARATGTAAETATVAAGAQGGGSSGGMPGSATATAVGTGTGGTATASATIPLGYPNLTTAAITPVSGRSVASAFMAEGGALTPFDTTSQSVSTAVLNPSAVAGTDLPAGDTLLLDTEEGGGSAPGQAGSATATAYFSGSLDLSALAAGAELMLDLPGATLVGTAVTGVRFTVVAGSTSNRFYTVQTFNSGADALSWFTAGRVLDLGKVGALSTDGHTVALGLTLNVTTTVAAGDPGSGFYLDPVLGTPSPACFYRGTRILTLGGEVAVERIGAGDWVTTTAGIYRAVLWVGRRSYAGRFLAANPGVQPIRFRAGSLGGGLPLRDLLVSPNHSMFLDGVLVPARCLANGSTIVQERGLKQVDYFHVELDSHDVILAEGAPSESFVDDDSRGMFHNVAEWEAMHPGRKRVPAVFCAPRVESGPELEAARKRLGKVAREITQAA